MEHDKGAKDAVPEKKEGGEVVATPQHGKKKSFNEGKMSAQQQKAETEKQQKKKSKISS